MTRFLISRAGQGTLAVLMGVLIILFPVPPAWAFSALLIHWGAERFRASFRRLGPETPVVIEAVEIVNVPACVTRDIQRR